MLNISIKGLRIPLTQAITDAVYKKVGNLEKIVHTSGFVEIELGKPSAHHKEGTDIFLAEITLDTNGDTYFVQVTDADLYVALDRVVADMIEMVKQGKGKKQTMIRKGRMMIKKLLKRGIS
jgi:ribosomal subunit interface protein